MDIFHGHSIINIVKINKIFMNFLMYQEKDFYYVDDACEKIIDTMNREV